ncbi:MAG: hypothetical protein KGZ65_01395 [Sphingomonadales bacterium]|nr:hypothetical protein [Sphingomonadales bacterium]
MNQMDQTPPDPEAERKRIIKGRNNALALLLFALVVLFFFITISKRVG